MLLVEWWGLGHHLALINDTWGYKYLEELYNPYMYVYFLELLCVNSSILAFYRKIFTVWLFLRLV